MMSFKFKLQLSKESLARFSSMILIFLISSSLLLVKANSQSNEVSNNFGYALLIFSAVVIVLTILAITKNPVSDFLLKNYKVVIIALIILFILLYFIPQIPLKSITGLFVIPTTTTTTTIPEVKEEALTGLIQTFSEMQPGKVNSMKIYGEGVSLTELNLEVYNELKNVKIVVSKLSSKPISAIQYPSGNVYQYLEIEKTNIKDEDLKKVIIKFKVEKSWINENKIDESTISLNRYQDNVWVGLSTAKIGEDNEFIYFETCTASLSLYSITGSSEPLTETTTTTTVVTTTILTSTTSSEINPSQTTIQAKIPASSKPVSTEDISEYDQDNSIYIAYGGTPSGDLSYLNVLGEGLTYDIPEAQDGSINITIFHATFDSWSTASNCGGATAEGWSECRLGEATLYWRARADSASYNTTSTQYHEGNDIDTNNATWITKCLDLSSYSKAYVTFWYNKTATNAANERQFILINKTGAGTFVSLWGSTTSASAWTYKELNITDYISSYTCVRYMAGAASTTAERLRLDDFKIIGNKPLYRIEVWHNSSAISYSGILNSVKATLNFTTTQDDVYSLQIYNWVYENWEQTDCDSGYVTANTATQWWCNKTSSPINYISPDKKIRIRINSTKDADQGILKEDYVQFYVDYTPLFTYDCTAPNVSCTLTTVTFFYQDGSALTINYQKPVNFFNETLGGYQQISQAIVVLPSSHPAYGYGYRYGVDIGVYQAGFKDNISKQWEVAFNVSNFVIITDLKRVGYLDYSDMSNKTLQTPSTTDVTLSYDQINYTGVFTGIDIQYIYLTEKLKENIILNQTFRDSAPDPRDFGMNLGTTYLVFETQLDYRDLRVFVNDTEQTGNFTTDGRVEFKDALGNLKMFIPVAYAVDNQRDELGEPNNTERVRWRLVHYDSDSDGENEHFLYFGVPVTWLISAKYPVIIDPTNEFYFNKEIDYYSVYNDLNRYYFNATDAQQMINHFQDYWSKNEICIGFYINRWREYCTDAVDWTWYNSTDYSSYVNLTGVAEAFYGKDWYQKTSNYRVRVFLEHYLESDSPDVKVSVKIQNVGKSDIQDTYIKVWTHDIRVNLTYDNDTFRVNTTSFWEAWSGWKQYLLDQSGLDLFYTENDLVTRKYAIFDNTTESWVEMEWNDSYWKNGIGNSMNYNLTVKKGTEANAPVDLVFLTGSLNKNDVISTNFKWADAIKQNFTEAYETYNEITEWTLDRIYDSFENGTDFYIQDFNMTVEMKSTGIVNVKYNFISVNENITYLYSFFEIAHKFGCYEYLKLKEIIKNSTYCPENETTYEQISYDLAKEEATLSNIEPGQVAFKYTLPNMTVDDSTGVGLLSYKSNLVPTENETYKKTRIKLPSVFSTKNYEDLREFDIDFGYTGTSHCIKVPINQFSNFTLNVTMLAPVANHTFSRDDFVLENYTLGNSLIAKIKPYPCCGIATDKTLEVEVCS